MEYRYLMIVGIAFVAGVFVAIKLVSVNEKNDSESAVDKHEPWLNKIEA